MLRYAQVSEEEVARRASRSIHQSLFPPPSLRCAGEVLGEFTSIDPSAVGCAVGMMARTASSLDDSLSLHGAFSMAVSGKYLEFDSKFDADKEDSVRVQILSSLHLPSPLACSFLFSVIRKLKKL